LVRELREQGIGSTVVAPLAPDLDDGYRHDGTVVRTYSVNAAPTPGELRGERPHQDFSRFREIVADINPDVYHQHSWTRGLGLPHLRAAHELGLPTVLTVHVPGLLCRRGTMMRFGEEACDGRIDGFTCAACWNQSRGAPKPLAAALAGLSATVGAVAERVMPPGRLATALSAFAMIERARDDVLAMVDCADRIVAVCQWLYDALLLNGVPAQKLVLSRQGVDCQFAAALGGARSARQSSPDNAVSQPF